VAASFSFGCCSASTVTKKVVGVFVPFFRAPLQWYHEFKIYVMLILPFIIKSSSNSFTS
jgi:hypothetical protein